MAMNSCIIKTATPEVYESWKQKVLDDNFNLESFKQEFIQASIKIKGKSITNTEKIKLLKNILQDIKLEMGEDIYEIVKPDIDEIITALDTQTVVKNPTKVITKPRLNEIATTLDNSKDILGVSDELGSFIPIVSSEINAFIIDFIQSKLAEICVWDEQSGIMTVSDVDITQALVNFQRELINILKTFTEMSDLSFGSVFTLDDVSVSNYNTLLTTSWNKIKTKLLQGSNGVFKSELTDSVIQSSIMPIAAFYILQNFDNVVQQMLSNVVTITANEFGSLDISQDKYKRKQKQRKNFSWSSDVHSADGENIADDILITFVNNTVVKKGKTLEKSFLDALVVCSEMVQNQPPRRLSITNDEEEFLYHAMQEIWTGSGDIDNRINMLIDVLSDYNSLTEKLGYDRCSAFADRLSKYMKAYRAYYETQPANIQREMDLNINIGAKLLNQFTGKGILGFVQFNEDGTVNYLQSGHKKKSKEGVRNQIKHALEKTLADNFDWFSKGVMLGNTSADWILQLNSSLVIKYLTQVTGLNFADPDVRNRFQHNPLVITEFIRSFRHIVQEVKAQNLGSIEKEIDTILKQLVLEQSYVVFTNILIAENDFHTERIFSADGKEQPKTTIATLTTQFPLAVSRFTKSGFNTQANILTRNGQSLIQRQTAQLHNGHFVPQSDFVQHINYAGDVTTPGDGKTKKWVELTETQLLEEWVNGLYLDSAIKKRVLSFQLDAASDKPKVPIVTIQRVDGSVDFLELTEDEIIDLRFEQSKAYYNHVQELTLNKWKKLFQNDPQYQAIQHISSLKQLNEYLKQHPEITLQTLSEKLIQVQATDITFTFQNQIDFCEKDGVISMNNCLLNEIDRISKTVDYYKQSCETTWKSTASTLVKYAPTIKLDLNNLSKEEKEEVATLLDVSLEKLPEAVASLQSPLTNQTINDKNHIHYKFYRKWFHLMNLVREADTQLLQKHYWAHGKNSGDIIKEETDRINKSKKRNNALSGTFSPLQQGLVYGVPEQIRTATIQGLTTLVQNHVGQQEVLNSHDGAIYSSYILRLLERFSSPDVNVSDVSKIIALSQSGAGFEQIKCADYAMTNEWIRNTLTNDDHKTQIFPGHLLMQKMLTPAKITDTFFDNWAKIVGDKNLFTVLGVEPPIVYFQGRAAKLTSINRINGNWVQPVWEYVDSETGNEIVPMSIVQQTLGFENGVYINNLYDLWKLFGAEYSYSVNDDGEIVFANISQELVTYMMCLFDPSLKSQMIGKIIDENASKSTMQFKNTRDHVFNSTDPLVTGTLTTSAYGVQQDSSHLSEEDSISSLTQVINAIGLNGQNPELAQQMYELLGRLTIEAMQELVDLQISTNKTDFYIKLGKSIGKQLANNKVISNASTILSNALKEVIPNDKTFASTGLPISSNQLYHFVTSELLSKLNRIIKQKFAGTAVVQNPAQGIMGVYEDRNGVVYTASEIVNKAQLWYKDQAVKPFYTVREIVQFYLNSSDLFKPKQLTLDNWMTINIGDVIEIDGQEYTIDRPFKARPPKFDKEEDLQNFLANNPMYQELGLQEIAELLQTALRNGKVCYKKLNKKRNLATTNIWWQEERKDALGNVYTTGNNLWCLESTKALALADPDSVEYKAILSWHQANLKLLQENGVYIATWKQYKDWVKESKITFSEYLRINSGKSYEDFLTWKQQHFTKVSNLKKKGGEEVLPKYYRKKLGITGSLADIKAQGPQYFESLIRSRIELHKDIKLSEYTNSNSQNTFAVALGDVDIVFFHDPDNHLYENAIVESVGTKQYLVTSEGETFDQFNVKGLDASFNIVTRDKGKATIFVNLHNSDALNSYKSIEQLITRIPSRLIQGVHPAKSDRTIWTKTDLLENFDISLHGLVRKTTETLKSENLQREAKKTYNSFLLSLQTISARIPSQSYQSFLSNETVAFTEGEENNGYMNLWEMWFQGSDYDIDKAYTLIFALDGMGQIPGNALTDYSSPESIMESLLIPDPDSNVYCKIQTSPVMGNQFDLTYYLNQFYNKTITLQELCRIIHYNKIKNGEYVEFVYQATKDQIESNSPLIKAIDYIVTKLNQYNHSVAPDDSNYQKNRVMAAIRWASQDLRNLKASEVPMAAGYVNDRIDHSVNRLGDSKGTTYNNEDPTHIINFQFQAAIGKTGVGVSANAIKATGSIQQRANIQHLNNPNPFDFSIDLVFPIAENSGLSYTINEKLRHVPNSILTQEQLWNMYKTALESDQKHPFNTIFAQLINGETVIANSAKEQNFVQAYKELEQLGISNITQSDVLYQMYKGEENVADMISIFISLCTDNAKELQLYRIAGTPELLNIPLSLISIGVPVQDVTDICVHYLIPVLDRLNVGVDDKAESVQQIISSLASINSPKAIGYQSLLQVLKVGKEMRLLTKYFKINQGTSVKYAEVLDFLDSMQKIMSELNLHKADGSLVTFRDLLKETPEALQLREQCISKYDKTAFNLFDIIFNSAHYLAQLQAVDSMVEMIQNNIAVAKVTSEVYSQVKPIDDQVSSTRLTQIVQNVCFGNALQTLKDIAFDKESTIAKFGNWDQAIPNDAFIGVSTQTQIENFISFVENGVIPYLKTHYPDNYFVQTFQFDSHSGHYALPFASYEAKADLRIKQNINKTISAITKFSGADSGLKTLYGTSITIGDLLTMYANIIHLNRTNTLSAVLYSGTIEPSDLHYVDRVNKYYSELDVATGIAYSGDQALSEEDLKTKENAKLQLDNLIYQATCYAKAAISSNSQYTTTVDGKYVTFTVDSENKSSLFSMIPGQVSTKLGLQNFTVEEVSDIIRVMLKTTNSGCTLSENARLEADGLYFTVNIPHKTGDESTVKEFVYHGINSQTQEITQVQLTDIQEFLRTKVQSISSALHELFVNQSGIYMSGPIKGTFVDNTIQEAQKNKMYAGDKVLQSVIDWSKQKNHEIVIVDGGDYVKSHVERIGDKNIIVLTQSDFNAKIPLKNRLFTLINLMCDEQLSQGMPSENSRFKTLIQTLDPSIKSWLHNLTYALRQTKVQELIKTSPLMNFYYSNVVESQTEANVKRQALQTISDFSRALNHRDLYFYTPGNVKNFLNGDIFYDASDNLEYMLVGQDDENHLIMVSISPEDLGKVKLHFRMSSDKNLTLRQRVKIHANKSLSSESVKTFDSKNIIQGKPSNIHQLTIGSSVQINGKWNTIVDCLSVPAKTNYTSEYLLVDEVGEYSTISDIDNIQAHVIYAPSEIPSTYDGTLDTTKVSNYMKYRMLKSLGFGTIVKINGNEHKIKKVILDHIVTTQQEIYQLTDIESINYNKSTAVALDPFLLHTEQSKLNGTYLNFATLPEFNKGVVIQVQQVQNGEVRKVKPLNKLFIDPNTVKVSKQYNSIEVGDYVVHNADSFYYHILDIYTVEETDQNGNVHSVQYALCSFYDKNGYQLKVGPLSKLKTAPETSLYKHNDYISRANVQTKSVNAELSNEDKVEILMKRLGDTFGTTCITINDPNMTEFASIHDGTVVINLAKKPTNQNVPDYILSKGIHEFTHLALVALRAQNPDLYAKLIASIDSVAGLSGPYNTKTKQIEEYLVKKITEGISGQVSFDSDILEIIRLELCKLLTGDELAGVKLKQVNGQDSESRGLLQTIGHALQHVDNFSMKNTHFTISELRATALSEDILNNIEYECK